MTSAAQRKKIKEKRRQEKIKHDKSVGKNELKNTLTTADRVVGKSRIYIVLGVVAVFSAIVIYNFR